MKNKLLLVGIAFGLFSTAFSQLDSRMNIIPATGADLIQLSTSSTISQEKTLLCVDTLRYPQAKEQIIGDGSFFTGFSIWEEDDEAISQTFLNSSSLTISGVEFRGARSTSGAASLTVQASIYQVNASNAPTTLLGSGTLTFTETTYAYRYVTFSTPITVTGNYAVVLSVANAGGILSMTINNEIGAQSYDELLAHFYSSYPSYPNPNNWNTIPVLAPGYNFEALIAPIVSYTINTTGTVTPTTACLGEEVTFTNTTVFPQHTNRMLNYEAFKQHFGLSTVDSTYVWDLDLDMNPATTLLTDLVWNGNTTHTYAGAGTFSPKLLTLGGFWNACTDFTSFTVTVNPVPSAAFNYATTSVCGTNANITPASVTTPGGTFSSTTGLVFANASTGEINIAGSTPGTYVVTYTTGGTCSSTSTQTITISLDDATFNYASSTVCEGSANVTPSSVATAGGTFSSTTGLVFADASTGEIDIANSTSGNYTITYTTAGACPNTSTQTLTITSAPDATFTYAAADYCTSGTNPAPVMTGTAGTFTSTTGLLINASTGVINLAASTPGTYTVTNTIAASGTCAAATEVFDVTITQAGDAAFTYPATTYCLSGTNPSPTVTGTTGTFSSTTGLTVNAAGVIDLATSTAGTYTVTNEVAANGACPVATATASITVTANPDAAFTYAESSYCATGTATPTITGTTGTFTSTPAGLSINGTGVINLASSIAGTYTITNTIAATATCAQETATATVTVEEVPTATVTLSGLTLTATETGVTYQWINCAGNTPVAGATAQTFSPSTPGSYAVVITDGNCSTTSACQSVSNVGIEDKSIEMVTVYPNPTENTITIAGLEVANAVVSILDVNGRVLAVENTTATTLELSVRDFEAGVYFITVTSETINGTKRFIKK